MIYLDTSAMVKLVIREHESAALIGWLNNITGDDYSKGRTTTRKDCCTAQIGPIELMRAALRVSEGVQPLAIGAGEATSSARDAVAAARRLLGKIDTLMMTPQIDELASTIPPAELRTLDAIHLATILANKSVVSAVCAYDRRLIAACEQHDLAVVSPGDRP